MVPAILASDPWRAPRKREVLDLPPVHHSRILWEPGERESLLRPRSPGQDESQRARLREEERALFSKGGIIPIHAGWWLELEDLPLLAERRLGGAFVSHHDLLRPQLARRDVAAIPALLSLLKAWPREVMWTLVRIDSTDIASAFWNEHVTSPTLFPAYAASRPEAAALVLLPIALGPDGEPRKAALARIQALVNDDLDGWRDIRLYGKSPVARAVLRLDSTGQHVSVAIGDPWLERGTLLKDIPLARERELLELVGGGPASAGP